MVDSSEAVSVSNLSYSHSVDTDPPSLLDIHLHLPRGSRTILIGANGGWLKSVILLLLLTQLLSWEIHPVTNLGRETACNTTRR